MKKRILSLVLMVLMIASMVSVISVPAFAAPIGFTFQPSVLIGGGNEYNIVWHNNNVSIGWVTYTYKGTTYTVYDEENGVVRSDDNIHTVRVPMEHLDAAGSYEVHASTVVSRDGYDIKVSDKTTAQRSFKGFKGDDNLRIGFLSDSHLIWNNAAKKASMLDAYKRAIDDYMGTPDLVVMNGDITNNMQAEGEFLGLFELFQIAGHNGTTPVLYVIGNHEKRGKFSVRMEKYLTYSTGEHYGSFDIGPASIIITDIGEDKTDDHIEYGGLIDMDHYFEEQYDWLQLHPGYTDGAKYTFSIGHSPSYVDRYVTAEIVNVFSNLGTDVHICGHSHNLRYYATTNKVNFPVMHDGGHDNNEKMRTSLLTLKDGVYSFKGFDAVGATILEQTLSATANGSPAKTVKSQADVDVAPSTSTSGVVDMSTPVVNTTVNVPTAAGASTMALKGAADSTALTTKPVVFEAGNYYNVVWQTTAGIPCAGYVELSGEKKEWKDSHGGKLRTETTHSVRIPKEKLAGKTYTISSRVVTNYNAYGTYNKNDPTSYGPFVKGTAVKFAALPGDKSSKFTVIAVANKTGGRADAKKLKDIYKGTANMLVLLGDMTTDLNKEANFGKSIIEYANEVTGGAYPVMYLRGEGETKGEFAANVNRFIRPFTTELVTNRMYQSFVHGSNYSFIGLDTATTKADSDASYNGFAGFDKYRKEQVAWLDNMPRSFPGDYNVVFGNAPDLTNVVGNDFTKNFKNLKVQLAVTAGKGAAEFVDGGAGYSLVKVGDSKGVVLTLAKEKITVEVINDAKEDLGEVDITKVTYNSSEVTPPKPSNPGTTDKPSDDPSNEPSDDPSDDNNNDDNKDDEEDDDNKDNNNDDDEDDDNDSQSGSSGNLFAPGVDGSIYVTEVEDGWYEDYLEFDLDIETDASFSLDAEVTEGTFIYAVARVSGFNPNLYDDDSAEEKAASWAKAVGLTSSNLGGSDEISEDTAKAVVSSIFTA